MHPTHMVLTGRERRFGVNEIIVSKTDEKGKITYANRLFCRLAGYAEPELLGKPHNLIRHPDMPRCVFRLLWDTLQSGKEIFAFVINRAKNGDHYWVFAHVTPTFDAGGTIIGYHSSRRSPDRRAVEKMRELYRVLSAEERKHGSPKAGMAASGAKLGALLETQHISYDEFIFSLQPAEMSR